MPYPLLSRLAEHFVRNKEKMAWSFVLSGYVRRVAERHSTFLRRSTNDCCWNPTNTDNKDGVTGKNNNIGYFRVFKEYQQKSQIWKSETSPNQGTWLGIPWLGLVSLCQIWDFCGYSLNTLKYPILGICYFFLWVILEGKSNIRVLLVRCVTPYKRERLESNHLSGANLKKAVRKLYFVWLFFCLW